MTEPVPVEDDDEIVLVDLDHLHALLAAATMVNPPNPLGILHDATTRKPAGGFIAAEPAWVASQLLGLGVKPALSLFAHGMLAYGGFRDRYHPDGTKKTDLDVDRQAQAAWTAIVESWDIAGGLRSTWTRFTRDHKWSRRVMGPLATALDDSTDAHLERVRTAAEVLSKVSFGYLIAQSHGDPLGAVYAELVAQSERWREPARFGSTLMTQMHVMQAGCEGHLHVPSIREWKDMWCGSGAAIIGVAAAIRRYGCDPHLVTWYVSDPSQTSLSVACVNFAFYDIGKKVRITHDEETFLRWQAARAQGLVPTRMGQADIAKIRRLATA